MADDFVLVCAIDFGTTFSGYAFSFKSDPNNIKMNKNWGNSLGFQVVNFLSRKTLIPLHTMTSSCNL